MSLRLIAGKYKGRMLKTPKGPSTRPTQGMLREAVFNICQNEIPEARFLDLFAGSGAMGFEALSRGAAHITLVEQNRNAIAAIKENISLLQAASQTTLLSMPAKRALSVLTKQSSQFDLIYIDPPYDSPFDLDILPILAPNALVFVEEQAPKITFAELELKNRRRFGIALLSIFSYNPKS